MDQHGLLINALIYLSVTVVMVPIARRLGLGSVIGYLAAGVLIGPWGLKLITNVEDILHFAEFGVVLLLFLIGLELEPRRVWQMRMPIFVLGGAQVASAALAIGLIGLIAGWSWQASLVAGLGLAMSSTAMVVQTLSERNLLNSHGGYNTFAVLLFQDLAVVPILALLPLLAIGGLNESAMADGWTGALKGLAAIAAVVAGGRYLMRPLFRFVAATRLQEVFTATALLIVIGIAVLMQAAGLSMALGAFLAGMLLAESEYRHELESSIEPFKGLLLGLFFVSVGMTVDFGLLLSDTARVATFVAVLLGSKALLLVLLGRLRGFNATQMALFVLLLAPGGEFAFVVFDAAAGLGALSRDLAALLTLAVTISMLLAPVLILANDRLIVPRIPAAPRRPEDKIPDEGSTVIVAGFGRFGQIVTRLLHANRIAVTVLDHDPDNVEALRRFGFKVYYGDATRPELLESAGITRAKVFVLAIGNPDIGLKIAAYVRRRYPDLKIVARARNVQHALDLKELGIEVIERETFLAALRIGEETLKALGFRAYQAHKTANLFKRHNEALLGRLFEHRHEGLEQRVTLTAQAREQLAKNLEADERARAQRRELGWD